MDRELTKQIFEALQCGVIVVDADTNIILNINNKALDILQLNKSIIGSPCNKILCGDFEECEFKKNKNYHVERSEICFMTKLQKRKWLLRTAEKISTNGKNYIIESFTDITSQKLMESNYIDLVQYAPAGIYELDLRNYQYISINQVMLDYTEYTEEEFKQIGIIGILTEESKQMFFERMKDVSEGKQVSQEVEYEIVSKTGKHYWVLLNVRFIYNGDPTPYKAFCIVTNITTRKCIEQKLRAEKNRAQMYLDMAFDIFVALDLDGNITLINKTGCDILGSTEDKLIGLNWFDNFVPEDDKIGARLEFKETIKGLNGQHIRTWTNFINTMIGEKRVIRWKNKPVVDLNGNIVGTFSSGDDITNEYKEEKTLLKLWDKTQVELQQINPVVPFRRRSKNDRDNQLDHAIELISNAGIK